MRYTEEKLKLYANARAVLFIPRDEDYGYITLEAMAAGKAVITAKDSGGPLEFVDDQTSGLVVDPTPQAVAQAIDRVAEDPDLAVRCGGRGKKKLVEMNINWEHVVEELTRP